MAVEIAAPMDRRQEIDGCIRATGHAVRRTKWRCLRKARWQQQYEQTAEQPGPQVTHKRHEGVAFSGHFAMLAQLNEYSA